LKVITFAVEKLIQNLLQVFQPNA